MMIFYLMRIPTPHEKKINNLIEKMVKESNRQFTKQKYKWPINI